MGPQGSQYDLPAFAWLPTNSKTATIRERAMWVHRAPATISLALIWPATNAHKGRDMLAALVGPQGASPRVQLLTWNGLACRLTKMASFLRRASGDVGRLTPLLFPRCGSHCFACRDSACASGECLRFPPMPRPAGCDTFEGVTCIIASRSLVNLEWSGMRGDRGECSTEGLR